VRPLAEVEGLADGKVRQQPDEAGAVVQVGEPPLLRDAGAEAQEGLDGDVVLGVLQAGAPRSRPRATRTMSSK
jgi:hypothetical protein